MNLNICNCCTINNLPCKKKPNKGSLYCSIHEKCQEKNRKNGQGLCPKNRFDQNRYKENPPRQNIRTDMKAIDPKGRPIQTVDPKGRPLLAVDKRIDYCTSRLDDCNTTHGLLLKQINECKENNEKLLKQIEQHSNMLKNNNDNINRNEAVIRKQWATNKNYELNKEVPMKQIISNINRNEAGRRKWDKNKRIQSLNKEVPLTDDDDSSSFPFKNNHIRRSNYHFMNANNRFAFCG